MNSRPYLGETVNLTKGEYTSIEQILDEIGLKTELEKMDFVIDPITKHLSLWLHYWKLYFFQVRKLLIYLYSKASGYHKDYKQGSSKHSTFSTQDIYADYKNTPATSH